MRTTGVRVVGSSGTGAVILEGDALLGSVNGAGQRGSDQSDTG